VNSGNYKFSVVDMVSRPDQESQARHEFGLELEQSPKIFKQNGVTLGFFFFIPSTLEHEQTLS
jgi:hypothetical protein